MVRRWLWGLCPPSPQDVVLQGDDNDGSRENNERKNRPGLTGNSAASAVGGKGGSAEDSKLSQGGNDNAIANDGDEGSLDPNNEFVYYNKPLSDSNSDNGSLDGAEVFELHSPMPRSKKQFLEAALTAKSLSDLNYVHATEDPADASKWKSMTDLKYEDEDDSLGDNDLFELDESLPTKKPLLDAALTAKSISDLSFVFSAQAEAQEDPVTQDSNISNDSIGGVEVFELEAPIVRTKKQFLDAALTAKSLSDLNYVHAAEDPADPSKWKSMTDLKYDGIDDESLGDNDLFELDESLPTKKPLLDAALTAKSISDLNFVFSAHAEANEDPVTQNSNISNDSIEVEIFNLDSPIVRPKKKFLEAAFMAKSMSDLNYVHTRVAPMRRRKSMTDLKFADEESLGDNELFEFEEPIPAKKKFLDAALTAKSISDLNFVFAAQEEGGAISQSSNESNGSLGSIEVFKLDTPIVRPKKKFLDAAFMAKSMSDLNYVHRAQQPKASRRKSLTDLKYDDDRSLGDNELFEHDTPIVRPKKKFLEAALMAKSISDLKFLYLNSTTYSSSKDSESRDDTSNVVPEHLLHLSQPNLFHSSDVHSIDNDELFESLTEEPTERPILRAALEAKAQQQEGVVVIGNRDAPSALSDDPVSEIVPEHLVIANQPATTHAHDNYSIEVEDIFEHPPADQNQSKPLLKAALEAQAQLEDEVLAEEFAKSMSYLGVGNMMAEPSSTYEELSKSVPDHLAIVHQPTTALPTLDELSIDGDRLFDSPAPKGKNSLLQAALTAKENAQRFEISRSELRIFSLKD